MAQLEHADNLARFKDPRGRLLAADPDEHRAAGRRRLPARVDCIVHDGQGAPYLHYTNHKMRRDAFVPVDTDLAEAITAQQHAVLAEFRRTGLPASAADPQPGRPAAVQHRHVPR